jgi:hypothetical protein
MIAVTVHFYGDGYSYQHPRRSMTFQIRGCDKNTALRAAKRAAEKCWGISRKHLVTPFLDPLC